MGIYLNPSNDKFIMDTNAKIYIDKSDLIRYLNSVIVTPQRYVCVSRPRRFGKSMAVNMLTAYYSRGCESKEMFSELKIAESEDFLQHINCYNVITLNMQEFLSNSKDVPDMVEYVKEEIISEASEEIRKVQPSFQTAARGAVQKTLTTLYEVSGKGIIFIIDEWDCVMREFKDDKFAQEKYLDFLRDLLKDKGYIHLAYMTGILPIKKYGTHSALNMFDEFSMTYPGPIAESMGFTDTEVEALCTEYERDYNEIRNWYDGYCLKNCRHIYNPRSVVSCITFGDYGNYWNRTETYEALKTYIDMNYEGLKDDILTMMEGGRVAIHTESFTNDMATFASKDDVMTLLIHLGYLGYDERTKQVFIPNYEILNEFTNAVRNSDWGEVSRALELSQSILQAIWDQEEEKVARGIQESHLETAHLSYNDETALSYTLSLALYSARNFYTVTRELPAGKVFADLAYIPKKQFPDKPALLVELKWNGSADGAIAQIRQKEYIKGLEDYQGNLLLVGINYDRDTRQHECRIEKFCLG